ncbi:hypothetical protein [uncultured Stenotrophomonas sp.]|uniref:hypothetical protein n=1 Tax=uncultured Stenotrophomonas sp. TaxID=165438 RepID=UPI0025E6C437|nr:hypothetical protein [uncultured Stenotrophomonas sp.]
MTDARELLARLNAKTVRFDVGAGGGPGGLQNIDIAHALGLVPAGLGREVLECCYLDTEVRASSKLRLHVLGAVRVEWKRQRDCLANAQLDLDFNQAMAEFARTVPAELRAAIADAQTAYDAAKAKCWPRDGAAMLGAITLAALQEVAGSSACDACHGFPMVPCTRCGGTGYVTWSERTRANAIGRSKSVYRNIWAGMYGWVVALLRNAERDAVEHMNRALSTREVA